MAISDVQLKGSWYNVFDANGKKSKTLQLLQLVTYAA